MENISKRNNDYTMTRWDPYCADDLKLSTRRNIKIFNNEIKTGARTVKRIDVGIRVTSIW